MRRTASSVLRDLEIRVEKLERSASVNIQANMYSYIKRVVEKHLSSGLPLSPSKTQELVREVSRYIRDISYLSQDALDPLIMDAADHYFDSFYNKDLFLAKMRDIYQDLNIR